MAEMALFDLRVLLTGDLLRHHFEVHHVVAGWRLMALGAVVGALGRMPKSSNRPFRTVMAGGAVRSEKTAMAIPVRVACGAVQVRLQTGVVLAKIEMLENPRRQGFQIIAGLWPA